MITFADALVDTSGDRVGPRDPGGPSQGDGTDGAMAYGPGCGARARPTRHVGRKFLADGRVRPFHGNTIVCHLPQQGEAAAFNALLDIYREAPRHPFLRKVTLLPPSSYHVTIFAGANDEERKPGLWPADLPLDLPIDACGRLLGERLRAYRMRAELPLRFRFDTSEPSPDEMPLTLHLLPADAAEETKLRRLRDDLSEILLIEAADHAVYRFHVTLGYTLSELDESETRAFRGSLREWRERADGLCPTIVTGAPEYCTLTDMFAFHRQFFLSA